MIIIIYYVLFKYNILERHLRCTIKILYNNIFVYYKSNTYKIKCVIRIYTTKLHSITLMILYNCILMLNQLNETNRNRLI